ncbi:MAG: hypothetical protein ABIE55_02010 [Candidatus Aenigmatarchaeota archaeon]
MPYRTAFWILIFLTVISALLQMLGYNFMEVLIVLLIIDSLGFGSMIEIEKKKSKREADASKIVAQKIESLEKIMQDVLHRVSTNPTIAKLEEKMNMHRDERNNMLDRLSRKTLDLEQKINRFGASLAEHKEDIFGRLEKIEKPKGKDESFSLGELVYMDEDEENV